MSSILPQAFARSGPAGSTAAFDIASLMAGTSSCDQLELLACRMLLPLNTGSSRDCGSLKSLKKPTFGQITTCALGTLQNFVYSVSCGAVRKLTLIPSFSNWACATSPVFLPGSALLATMSSLSPPVHMPSALIGRLGRAGERRVGKG